MTVFLSIVLAIWTIMHLYAFGRMCFTPLITGLLSRHTLWLLALGLWGSYPVGRIFAHWGWNWPAFFLKYIGAMWIGVIFLLFCGLLATDVLTLGGWLFPRLAPMLRAWVVVAMLLCSLFAIFQGLRPPVVRDYEVTLPGLPKERDGLLVVEISDLHLGTLIGHMWLTPLVNRITDLHPDLLLVVGDVVDGDVDRVMPLVPELKKLQAPLGVWAVTGNHEYYAELDRSLALFEASGFKVLRDRWAEVAPGLVLAGVDDLTARGEFRHPGPYMETALANRPKGATILMSHSPMETEKAVQAGVGLMLSGHTHNGQIWPFEYFVQLRYGFIGGLYKISDMSLIICRGTGTWGPRMRLWRPSEIVRIKLRSAG